jgi:DNA mismatch repair protein MutL
VRQLFFNLPARRKFLRTEETEAARIQHYLTLAALAFPEVTFTFVKDGRNVWQLPAVKSDRALSSHIEALRERFRALLGDEKLLPVNFSAAFDTPDAPPEEADIFETASPEKPAAAGPELKSEIRIWGLLGSPGVSRATRDGQFIFVNRRPVENTGINYALIEGYHNALMKGRYPVCCLFLEINPAAVDVNIHPTKREVKFHREFEVRKCTAEAVRETLRAFHSEPAAAMAATPLAAVPNELEFTPATPAPASARPDFSEPSKPSPVPPPPASSSAHTPLKMGLSTPAPAAPAGAVETQPAAGNRPSPVEARFQPAVRSPQPAGPVPLLDVPLRMIGVIGRLYVVLESDRGLVLLDQHAAHERILFEQMMSRIESDAAAPSQKLLLPETIELPPRDAQFLREQLPELTRLGVGLSEFGERTFLLDALPPFVQVPDTRRFVFDLVDELRAAGRELNLARLGELTVAKTVCRHAVKANDPLKPAELENLVEDLRRCAMPYTCPHGRPTLIEMNYRELEKKFGRTQ